MRTEEKIVKASVMFCLIQVFEAALPVIVASVHTANSLVDALTSRVNGVAAHNGTS